MTKITRFDRTERFVECCPKLEVREMSEPAGSHSEKVLCLRKIHFFNIYIRYNPAWNSNAMRHNRVLHLIVISTAVRRKLAR